MRRQLQQVAEQARDQLLDWHGQMERLNTLTEEEAAIRYVQEHQGRPDALLEFVRGAVPGDRDALDAAVEYEQAMEDLLKRKRRRDAHRP